VGGHGIRKERKEKNSHPGGIGFAFHRAGRRTQKHTDGKGEKMEDGKKY
jgi:hypothetical protein